METFQNHQKITFYTKEILKTSPRGFKMRLDFGDVDVETYYRVGGQRV